MIPTVPRSSKLVQLIMSDTLLGASMKSAWKSAQLDVTFESCWLTVPAVRGSATLSRNEQESGRHDRSHHLCMDGATV